MYNDSVIFTKESIIARLKEIRNLGWIKGARSGNVGSVGNTIEDLLGIKENNLPIPDAAEWELKCQRINTTSLTTLFHNEPSPTALKFVPAILLPNYGWPHKEAGNKYPNNEISFRQTISAKGRSDRGFTIVVNENEQKILVSFNAKEVSSKHSDWLSQVISKIGDGEINPQPYWEFDDLYQKARTKLHNCFFVGALDKKIDGVEYFNYTKIFMLKNFSKKRFIKAISDGDILIDFDARTGHNHGTKFRFRNNKLPNLYKEVTEI